MNKPADNSDATTSPELENLKNNSSEAQDDTPQHGGARPGAGRPKGSENDDTKRRRMAATQFKDRVATHVDKLFNAQLDKAVGEKFLFVSITINKGKKNERKETSIVTDPETIKRFLDGEYNQDGDDEYYFISTKAADNYAIESLLNRAFGTAVKAVDVTSKGESLLQGLDDKDLRRIATATSEALENEPADN